MLMLRFPAMRCSHTVQVPSALTLSSTVAVSCFTNVCHTLIIDMSSTGSHMLMYASQVWCLSWWLVFVILSNKKMISCCKSQHACCKFGETGPRTRWAANLLASLASTQAGPTFSVIIAQRKVLFNSSFGELNCFQNDIFTSIHFICNRCRSFLIQYLRSVLAVEVLM